MYSRRQDTYNVDMLLLVLNAAAVAEPEWATAFRQLQEQVASLQGRVTSLETENAGLRRQARRSLEPALTRVETQGLGASRRLSESAPSCCRWTASRWLCSRRPWRWRPPRRRRRNRQIRGVNWVSV